MTGWDALRLHVARLARRDDLAELKRRPQGSERVDIDASVVADGLEISTSRIPDGTRIRVEGTVEAGLNELDVNVSVSTTTEGECRRCLEPVVSDLVLDVHAVFVDEADPDADTYPIDGDWIDVGAVVREELLLALPLSPLCTDDCVGADPDRFPTNGSSAPDPEDARGEVVDPRWAPLSQLTFDED